MQVDHEWNRFMLSTINNQYSRSARRGQVWHHVTGNLYRSSSGDQHVCDQTCIRWVYRSDGMKICAITGLCKNSSSNSLEVNNSKRSRGGFDMDGDQTDVAMCAEDAISNAMSNAPKPVTKKRSFREPSTGMEMEEKNSEAPVETVRGYDEMFGGMVTDYNNKAVPQDYHEASYGGGSYCDCNGYANQRCCGVHY